MTKKELEQLLADMKEQAQRSDEIIEQLRLAAKPKPSVFSRAWNWCKPFILPFVLGVIIGGLYVNILTPPMRIVYPQSSKLEPQVRELVLSAIDIVDRDIENGTLQEEEAVNALLPLVPTPAKPLVQHSESLEEVKKKMKE